MGHNRWRYRIVNKKTSGFYEGMVVIRYRDSQNVETKNPKRFRGYLTFNKRLNFIAEK